MRGKLDEGEEMEMEMERVSSAAARSGSGLAPPIRLDLDRQAPSEFFPPPADLVVLLPTPRAMMA